MNLQKLIRNVPDFPKPGIIFKDIMPLLANPKALSAAVKKMAVPWKDKKIDKVVSAEAR
jgi:adenine phosphoribosyltransferase